jgi:hypothetical protein
MISDEKAHDAKELPHPPKPPVTLTQPTDSGRLSENVPENKSHYISKSVTPNAPSGRKQSRSPPRTRTEDGSWHHDNRLRIQPEVDDFASFSQSSSVRSEWISERQTERIRQPPRIEEGPYNIALSHPQGIPRFSRNGGRVGNVIRPMITPQKHHDSDWPPNRNTSRPPSTVKPPTNVPPVPAGRQALVAAQTPLQKTSELLPARPKVPVASSSKVLLEDMPAQKTTKAAVDRRTLLLPYLYRSPSPTLILDDQEHSTSSSGVIHKQVLEDLHCPRILGSPSPSPPPSGIVADV